MAVIVETYTDENGNDHVGKSFRRPGTPDEVVQQLYTEALKENLLAEVGPSGRMVYPQGKQEAAAFAYVVLEDHWAGGID